MPVNSKHIEYQKHEAEWQKIRDAVTGTVKQEGFKYLRRPDALDWHDAPEYLKSALYFNAVGRSVDGMLGSVMRRPPVVEVPKNLEPRLESIGIRGEPFEVLAKQAVRETVILARYGLLVDMPQGGGDAYICGVRGEDLINWRVEVIDGRERLTWVVLRENALRPKEDDRFKLEVVKRYRLLELVRVEGQEGLVYSQSVFEEKPASKEGIELIEGPIVPTRTGQPLSFIPFTFVGPNSLSAGIEPSPIGPLVEVNLSHFNSSASLEHGRWWTALPIYAIYTDQEVAHMKVGPSTVWKLNKEDKAEIIDFKGQGLGSLENALAQKEKMLQVLGAKLLEPVMGQPEAAAAISLRHRGESSVLANISDTCSRGLSRALSWWAWWQGSEEDSASVQLNTQFFSQPLDGDGILKLVGGWQSGAFGTEALFRKLQDGEAVPDDWSFERYMEDVQQQGAGSSFLEDNSDG